MYQSYWQLRTGECTLFFVYEGSGTIYMKGIGKPQEIQQLAQQLESLRNQLRSTLAIKSGIYG